MQKINAPTLEDLEKLIVANEEFSQLENKLGKFCIFEAMNLVRGEVKLGNLFSTFLDPAGSHGFGAKILRVFLMEAVRAGKSAGVSTENFGTMDFYLCDLDNAKIYREWNNIDIFVEVPGASIAIAIELKITSKQGNSQLSRYRSKLEASKEHTTWKKIYVFLTVDPEEPSDKASIPLRYQTLVPVLERVIAPEAMTEARAAYDAFLAMLRRHHVTDDKLEEIARRLWSTHRAALTFLADRRPEGLRGLFANLLQQTPEIALQLSGDGFTFTHDVSTTGDLRFACKEWDLIPALRKGTGWTSSGRMLLFELKRFGNTAVGELYLGPGPGDVRAKIVSAIGEFRHRKDMKPGSEWMCVAKQNLLKVESDNDIDIDVVKNALVQNFGKFCREKSKLVDGPLRKSFSTMSDSAS